MKRGFAAPYLACAATISSYFEKLVIISVGLTKKSRGIFICPRLFALGLFCFLERTPGRPVPPKIIPKIKSARLMIRHLKIPRFLFHKLINLFR
jgi:hypothetical protein